MGESEIRNRIDRAHRKAAHELMDYLHERLCEEPRWEQSRTDYCSVFINEVYINDEGIKDYDRENLSQMMPHVIREFSSDEFVHRLQNVLMEYKQSLMKRKLMMKSAMAILSSKFLQKDIDRLDIMTLLEKVEGASGIKDLFCN